MTLTGQTVRVTRYPRHILDSGQSLLVIVAGVLLIAAVADVRCRRH